MGTKVTYHVRAMSSKTAVQNLKIFSLLSPMTNHILEQSIFAWWQNREDLFSYHYCRFADWSCRLIVDQSADSFISSWLQSARCDQSTFGNFLKHYDRDVSVLLREYFWNYQRLTPSFYCTDIFSLFHLILSFLLSSSVMTCPSSCSQDYSAIHLFIVSWTKKTEEDLVKEHYGFLWSLKLSQWLSPNIWTLQSTVMKTEVGAQGFKDLLRRCHTVT